MVGRIVTLINEKAHPDPEELPLQAGITGLVVGASNSGDGAWVVDFGPNGQWNCTNDELEAEGIVRTEERVLQVEDRAEPADAIDPEVVVGTERMKKINTDKVLSFEEELAIMQSEKGS